MGEYRQNGRRLTTITGDYSADSGANLEIELLSRGTPGLHYGQLSVQGQTAFGGTLKLSSGILFLRPGDTFDILNFDANTLTGEFSEILAPTVPLGLRWDFSSLYTTGVIAIIEGYIDGDFNGDGEVSQADLTLLLSNWGQTAGADWIATDQLTGKVDQDELSRLLSNWGAGAVAATAAVPEPSTVAVLLAGLVAVGRRRRE